MNKPALKKFATEARRELLERVELQARKIGITSEGFQKAAIESSDAIFIDDNQLKEKERIQRNKLINRIREIGFDRVMEEVSYTWFNRFTALRFMEINDYLPTKVRVLSSVNPESTEPDMMKEALNLKLDLDKEYIYELKMKNNDEELFKYLMIKHCNDLNRYMPFMFETIDDYTEILFPQGLLATDSCIRKMTNIEVIPENNWEKIEVVGWLYQYYIAEEKDRVFKAKEKYKAEEIPFATQLFTPDWIVRYMVQNSLGRYWVETNPEHQDLISKWEFYLQNSEEDFDEKIAPYINKKLKVEEIKCFDPAMGSGHILVYMFDVLYEIYSKSGYMEREIPRLIIENNLYGLDIDDRAYQLASFSVVMKASEYNKRFLKDIEREGLTLNLASIQETNNLIEEDIQYLSGKSNEVLEEVQIFIQQFQDAKTIGSLIKVTEGDTKYLEKRLESIKTTPVTDLFEVEQREKVLFLLPDLIKQAKIMSLKFDILVTNPPYMGSSSMSHVLIKYLRNKYPNSKKDLFAAFMEVDQYLKPTSFYAYINQHSWMFLSSYEKLRNKIINQKHIENMLHLGTRAFEEIGGEVVQTTAFVLRNSPMKKSPSLFVRLVNEKTAEEKKKMALEVISNNTGHNYYYFKQENFKKIPGNLIAYWVSNNIQNLFLKGEPLGNVVKSVTKGIFTGDNNKFIRYWFEVNYNDIETGKWNKYSKGGSYRKWYGNSLHVVKWEENALELREFPGSGMSAAKNYGMPHIVWSGISTSGISFRYDNNDVYFDDVSPAVILEENEVIEFLTLLNSKPVNEILKIIAPTIHYQAGDIKMIPALPIPEVKKDKIIEYGERALAISKMEWNSFELSWDFKKHFLLFNIESEKPLHTLFSMWNNKTVKDIEILRNTEQELNQIYIELYGLDSEITPEVEDKDITIRRANLERDIKSFISYAIGCFFGRYSIEEDGLVYAGGEFDSSRYNVNLIDKNNIIPVLPEAYLEEDIVAKFIKFLQVTFDISTQEKNLKFIADALRPKNNETSRETLRRYFINDFYKEHIQNYSKRPIYWLFTSGKEKAFNCLIYMHRYDKTTLSRIRTDYLHEVQIRMDSKKKDLLNIIDSNSSTKEISNAKKELKSLDKKIDELKAYDEKLHHMADMQIEIDLDDGVAANYAKFEGLVAKI